MGAAHLLFEMVVTSFLVFPIPDHAFFEKPEFERLLSHNLLQIAGFAAQVFGDLVCGRSARCVACQPLLAGFGNPPAN